MANIKVSELSQASTLNNEDLLMIVQNNESKKLNGEIINNKTNYSTNEIVVGKFNNKPLYRKVVQFTSTATNTGTDTGISNMETLLRFDGMIGNGIPLNFRFPNSDNYTATFYDTATAKIYNISSTYVDLVGYAILEYTKTTD